MSCDQKINESCQNIIIRIEASDLFSFHMGYHTSTQLIEKVVIALFLLEKHANVKFQTNVVSSI